MAATSRPRTAGRQSLQWGHDPKTVDGGDAEDTLLAVLVLQWGHDPKTVDGLAEPGGVRTGGLLLQWGHDPKTVDGGPSLLVRSMRRWLQWGHDPKTVDGTGSRPTGRCAIACFNGATIRRPWMAAPRRGAPRRSPAASMGPRSEDRGWVEEVSRTHQSSFSFNGATIRRPWMVEKIAGGKGIGKYGFNGATIRRPWMGGR